MCIIGFVSVLIGLATLNRPAKASSKLSHRDFRLVMNARVILKDRLKCFFFKKFPKPFGSQVSRRDCRGKTFS